jgi:hypothetical protein
LTRINLSNDIAEDLYHGAVPEKSTKGDDDFWMLDGKWMDGVDAGRTKKERSHEGRYQ